jgi:hypothetical protein
MLNMSEMLAITEADKTNGQLSRSRFIIKPQHKIPGFDFAYF